jgi:hypothetical protein
MGVEHAPYAFAYSYLLNSKRRRWGSTYRNAVTTIIVVIIIINLVLLKLSPLKCKKHSNVQEIPCLVLLSSLPSSQEPDIGLLFLPGWIFFCLHALLHGNHLPC